MHLTRYVHTSKREHPHAIVLTSAAAINGALRPRLLVFYLPESFKWAERCSLVVAASFKEVQPFNPYWSKSGRTFADPDGYRVVLQNAAWTTQGE